VNPKHLGIADHAVVGQAFAQHHIIGTGQRCQGEKDAVRRAVGDEDVIALDLQPLTPDPVHRRLTMGLEAGDGSAGTNPGLVFFGAELGAGVAPEAVVLEGVHDACGGEVHQRPFGAVEYVSGDAVAHAPGHKTASPDLATHQPLPLQLFIGIGHGLHADAYRVCDLTLWRQTLIVHQHGILDVAGDGLHQNLVLGFATPGLIHGRSPFFHHCLKTLSKSDADSIP
jgi:hypothetical protein